MIELDSITLSPHLVHSPPTTTAATFDHTRTVTTFMYLGNFAIKD